MRRLSLVDAAIWFLLAWLCVILAAAFIQQK